MRNILLINPAQNIPAKPLYPSGALLLLGTMAHNAGHSVKIIDDALDPYSPREMRMAIQSFNPSVLGITVNTFQVRRAKQWLQAAKKINPEILTVIGGPHPSALGPDAPDMFPDADVVVYGEGEHTFLDLVEDRDHSPRPKDLDYIPLPNLDLVELERYPGYAGAGMGNAMYIMASRGCPYQCSYCNKSVFGTHVRYRSPIKVIQEVAYLAEHGVKEIFFQDDTFNLNRGWIEEILNLIIARKLNHLSYVAPFRANEKLVDRELLGLAKRAGFRNIFYGVESGSQMMLDNMRKGLTTNEIRRAFKLTHEAGLGATASFIIGLPGETRETIRETVSLLGEIRPEYAGFTLATPFPNTLFDSQVRENGHLLNDNYDEYRCGGSYVRTDELTKTELEYYANLLIISQKHPWVYRLMWMGRYALARALPVGAARVYRRLRRHI